MAQYIGEVCPVCKQRFKKGDDIVVCPECGAPHHRSCYVGQGECAFSEKHKEGFTASRQRAAVPPKHEEAAPRPEQNQAEPGEVCSSCGNVNPPDGLFCIVCGNTLKMGGPQQGAAPGPQTPFAGVKPDTDIQGIPAKDFAAYVGSNAVYYLPKFEAFGNKHKTLSINFTAMLFPSLYYLYRKMYPLGIVFLAINIAFNILSMVLYMNAGTDIASSTGLSVVYYAVTILSVMSFLFSVLSGLFANRMYYNKAVKDIQNCRRASPEPQAYVPALMKKGSVSFVAIATAFILLSVVTVVLVYASILYQ